MKTSLICVCVLGLALLPAAMLNAEEITLSSLPEAVKKTAEPLVAGAKIEEVEDTVEDGVKAFEVEYEKDGKEMAIVIAPDGKLIQTEYRLSLTQTPEAITKGVEKAQAGAKITSIKKIEKGSESFYKVSAKGTDGKVHKLKLDDAGGVVSSKLDD